jgi:hypothetical protein
MAERKTMMTTGQIKDLVTWIIQNAWQESVFLTPYPQTNVDVHNLLDRLHELSGIDKEQIGDWVDEANTVKAEPPVPETHRIRYINVDRFVETEVYQTKEEADQREEDLHASGVRNVWR